MGLTRRDLLKATPVAAASLQAQGDLMRYDTGNPVEPNGSSDPRDLYDNAGNFDLFVNGEELSFSDRTGKLRKSFAGMENDFQQFLVESGYQDIGTYAPGLTVTARNQMFIRAGEYYRAGPATTLPYTVTGNWTTDAPFFVSIGDAVLRQDLASPTGTDNVGRGSGTLEQALDAIEVNAATLTTQVAENKVEAEQLGNAKPQLSRVGKSKSNSILGVSPINILGDSISHGAFALNLFTNSWVNLFKRMCNAEFDISGSGGLSDSSSYGFAPLSVIGSGGTLSTEIHDSNSISGFTSIIGAGAAGSLAGIWFRSTSNGSLIDTSVPTFQGKVRIYYVQQPTGATFDIVRVTTSLSEVVLTSVNSAGTLDYFKYVDVPITDNGRGTFRYRIKQTSVGQLDVNAGASYLANVERSVVNNFSQSGRRLAECSEDVIRECIRGAQLFICALSHNDAADAESTPAYFDTYKQRIDWIIQYANQFQTPVVFADFCWSFPKTNKVRVELRRVTAECGGVVVDFPGHFRIDGDSPTSTDLISGLGLFVDAAHPNVLGHQVIAEIMAKAIGLSVSSKRQALEQFDWWMPLALDPGANVINTDTGHRLVSAVKRSGAGLMVKVRIREAAGANPFPVGVRNIQASWPTKYALANQSIQTASAAIEFNDTTGAITTQCSVTAGGQVRINQIATKNQDIVGNIVGPAM